MILKGSPIDGTIDVHALADYLLQIALLCVGKTSLIKRHNAYSCQCKVCVKFACEIEIYNRFSSNIIPVKKHFQVMGHVLNKKRCSLMKDLKFYLVTATISDEN